jgi:hypothetical protein
MDDLMIFIVRHIVNFVLVLACVLVLQAVSVLLETRSSFLDLLVVE